MSAAIATTKTAEIKNEFMNLVADDTEYTLQEMKAILGDVFKTKNNKKVTKKATKSTSSSDNSDEETTSPKKKGTKSKKNKDDKVKKAPNAYNRYVKEKMPEFKKEHPETPATGLMSLIGASWKNLTKEEKDAYKAKEEVKEDNVVSDTDGSE